MCLIVLYTKIQHMHENNTTFQFISQFLNICVF